MSYFLYYSEDGYYDGEHYCGWGDFKCSVCNKCVRKCMDVGKAKLLKDARSYEPHTPREEEPEWLKEVPSEYKSVASVLPLVAILGMCVIVSKQCHDLPKNKRKDNMKAILAALALIKLKSK